MIHFIDLCQNYKLRKSCEISLRQIHVTNKILNLQNQYTVHYSFKLLKREQIISPHEINKRFFILRS